MRKACVAAGIGLLVAACGGGGGGGSSPAPPPPPPPPPPPEPVVDIRFERVAGSGLLRAIDNDLAGLTAAQRASGGLAAADYDGDGDVDLYVVGDPGSANHFYENRGDGTFAEVGTRLGVDFSHWGSGPAFGDIDGDGDLDLFVGAVEGDRHYLLENRVDEAAGRFVDITAAAGIALSARNTVSATFADYDQDGFVDLFLAHWGARRNPGEDTETVWRNNGDGTFTSASVASGIAAALTERDADWSFTPNLADIDRDGNSDLLLAAEFEASEVFRNNGDGTFTRTTDRDVISDQGGMGGAVADFDNDGDLDWFVTSVYDLERAGGERIGNRLYENDGVGVFADATSAAGVADGGWGWGSCAADFDNDGAVDIAQVNGWITVDGKNYRSDRIRFFHNQGGDELAFRERGEAVGLANTGQGRGIACFDAERDGDIDIVIVNMDADGVIAYRNETANDNHYLGVKLEGAGGNRFGVGARVTVTATETGTQVRQLGGANNYASHDPLEAHFGLGADTTADVAVRWPDGSRTTEEGVAADQVHTIRQPPPALRLLVAGGDGDGVYAPGDQVAIQAGKAPEHYHFSHWTSDGGGAFADAYAEATTFTMPATAVTITAHYTPGVALAEDVSVARRWNEVLLQSIRNDFARPTVHARNLFHVSAAVYDAWTAYGDATPWLLGRSRAGVACAGDFAPAPEADVEAARAQAASFAAYRIIRHRFRASPGATRIRRDADSLMSALGYDVEVVSTDYSGGAAAALGNHIAECYLAFGLADGANEANNYANVAYQPVNPPLKPEEPGNPDIVDLNRWQPLSLREFIDQAGNPVDSEPEFLSPEWGGVTPFALSEADRVPYERDGFTYWVWHDPGPPPTIDGALADSYKWAFALVSVWSAHLAPDDGVTMDISPASIGNVPSYPADFVDYPAFFNTREGGDPGAGHDANPATGEPYAPQVVPRGDYTRVLAEFWADGPDSETPPGHWFTILNEVNEHPALRRRFRGEGPELGRLEWDVKAYFALGGAMHDAAIAAWSAKGWYDYIRPISALRAMADRGQSSHPDRASHHADGLPLMDGFIELVAADDPLAGEDGEHVGKIKLYAWRGPEAIDDPAVDVAGVGWILAENWWPYQRPTFVTPPFAGYVSGHSTYSRAAAEVLTALTGDAYFPGGMSGFEIPANEFLVFEDGPSVDMTLQWATYRDASDQCSLSRIWGGIHPPLDDIPGRLMGRVVGVDAFALATEHFEGRAR